MLRDTFALIDISAFKHNLLVLEKTAGVPLMAVVKADAYGHGARRMSAEAWNAGVRWYAVSNPDEALEIRDELPNAHILVLSSIMEKACKALAAADISVAAYTPEHIASMDIAAAAVGKKALVHLKADTGMGRIGFSSEAQLQSVLKALKASKNVVCEGLFTHFASADETYLCFAELQHERFVKIKKTVEAAGFSPLCHAANSAGIIALPGAHYDFCRAGISMYGYPPSDEIDMKGMSLTPVMSFISYVAYIKTIHSGDSVSYGRKFVADSDRLIATVPAGYADGYQRALSGKAEAYINGFRVKQIGRVCMDQIMFDVTGLDVQEGDTVELFGKHIGANELASIAGTISYELLTGITKRVPRVYE